MKKRILVKLIDRWHQTGSNNLTLSAVDVFLLFLAVYMGYALRLTIAIPDKYIPEMVISGMAFAGVIQTGFFIARLHRVYWLQASVEEFYRMSWTYLASSVGFVILSFYILPFEIPRTSLAIFICLGFIFLCIVRASLRFVYIGDSCKPCRPSEGKAFVVGAGQAGCLLVRDLKRSGSGFKPVAFFDDDPGKIGKSMAGIPVLDSIEKLPNYTREYDVNMVLIALPSLSGGEIQEILKKTDKTGLEVRVLPGLFELAEGSVTVNRLRKVSIEDLLRREPIKLDLEGIGSVITDKTILITGAGGSIGSEICRQVASHRPKEIIALGHGEFSIYTLLEGLEEDGINVPVYPVIADVADDKKMSKIFEKHKPQVIFHAAAHKHVPLMECNPDEAIRVNCWGTWTIARLAGEHGAERMVMISTDKAVNPTSVMGATKRLAEMLIQEAQEKHTQTAYMAVRFGNVLGSRGSVIPKFERQIEKGGPITVTHPDMRRYFMLIPEAVSLVLQASALGQGNELFVLDMGEPVKIVDLAEMMIRSHGYEPGKDIPIKFSGIRPGEKLFEELFYNPNNVDRTGHDKIFLSRLDSMKDNSHNKSLSDSINSIDVEFLAKIIRKDGISNEE